MEDLRALWEDGRVEARIVAAKLLGRLGLRNPSALSLLRSFVKDLRDWPSTDTLATQGIRGLLKAKAEEIKALALHCLSSENPWTRRFGVVVFVNFPKDPLVSEVLSRTAWDREPAVKKALAWLRRKAERS